MLMPKPWIAVAAGCLAVGAIGGTVFARQTAPAPAPPDTNVSLPASAPAPSSAPVSSSAPEPAPAATPVPSQSQEPAGGDIGVEGAKTFALAHAGVSAQDAAGMKVEQEWENGRMEYEVEFWNGTVEYDYTIDGTTGDVLKCQQENHVTPAPGKQDIGAEGAKSAALAHAGLSASVVTNMRVEGDWEDGRMEYEVEFWSGNVEYDYTIDGSTGGVLEYDQENHGGPATPAAPPAQSAPANGDIGTEGAKTAALTHAGVSAQLATGMKVEQDWENGRLEYEVEFWNGSTEYDYTIDGATGSVLEYKKEVRAAAPNATGTAYIGETAAGEVALAHAGLTQAAASDYRCWMDYDDGYPHCYRVEFTTGPSLYQYQIGLYDGAVLHHGCSSYGGHHQSSRHGGCHY